MSAKQYVDLPDLTVYHEELMEYLSEQGMSDAIILQGVLTSGSNSITFTNSNITSSSRFDIYANQKIYKTSAVVSGNTLTITFDSAASGDVLVTVIVNWDRGTVDPTYFGGLYDVNITNPLDGQVPRYNAQTSKWENGDASVVGDLNDLDDVDINSPQEGDLLGYNGNENKWVNKPVLNELIKWSEATTSVKKNLLKNIATSTTINGVTFTVNSDGSVTANGTATALAVFDVVNTQLYSWKPKFSAGSYKLSCENVVAGTSYFALTVTKGGTIYYDYLRVPEGTSEVTWTDADISDITDYFFGLVIQSGQTVNNVTFYPMFRLASIADDTYEPYIPDNTELMRYTDNAVLGAKNLLPNNAVLQTIHGVTFTVNADGSVTSNGTQDGQGGGSYFHISDYFYGNGNYIINGCPANGSSSTYRLYVWDNDARSEVGSDTGNGASVTLVSGHRYTINIMIGTSQTVSNIVFKPMIRLATDTDDTYAPYAMTNRELTEEVGSIETEIDRINNNSQGKETIIRIINENGTWNYYGNGRFTSATVLQDIVTYLKQNYVKADIVKIYSNSNGNAFNYSLPIQTGALVEIVGSPYAYISGNWDRCYVKVTDYSNGDVYMAGIINNTVGTFKKISYTS